MGTNKIINNIKAIFEQDRIKKPHCEELKSLLEDLKKKQKKIKAKIELESSKKKRKQLKMDLKIVTVQLRKGYSKLDKLKKCASSKNE